MRAVAADLPATARMFVPQDLINLLIDLCKAADQGEAARNNQEKNHV